MNSRRNFIKKSAIVGAGISVMPNLTYGFSNKREKLKVALIGVGLRGTNHLTNLLNREDVIISAICDIDPARIKIAEKHISDKNFPKAQVFGKND
ncbi:twin-arginine translocation signal domain-containing protein, partial [Aureibaculum sp. 2210JD6-5]|uniref:twin-arginine translocation signal domain-containing protein n=1 Tax=Aureibaculum sp. 2210JD6-5 TaxID=3103957 RepID=UPI002AAC8E57